MVIAVALTMIVAGCSKASGGNEENGDRTVVTLYSTVTNEADKITLQNVVEKFEKENPDIDIKENYPADGYEGMLRVKMAANDMPDLFDTHGWALHRYGEYVEDLKDMDWVKDSIQRLIKFC